jgi:hypothetical protein
MIKLGEEKFGKEWMERALVSETRVARVRTLSSILRELDIPSIDFLKIDTEGDEDAVLDGIQEEQFGIIRHIAMEIHTEKLYRDIQKKLSQSGCVLHSDAGLAEFAGTTNLYAAK